MKTIHKLALTLLSASSLLVAEAQDIHFADIQQMSKWTNQSLNWERRTTLHANFRDIRYASNLSFRTGGALVSMPVFRGKDTANAADKGYFTATGAAGFDQTNTGFFKSTTALVGLSYAQPLSRDGIFASVGFQGAFVTNKFGASGTFPDQLDQYGPIPNTATNDPLRAGNRYNYFSLNAGASVFKNEGRYHWMIGASVRHLNRPNADASKADIYRIAPTVGIQSRLARRFDRSQLSAYALLNWRSKANEALVGAQYQLMVEGKDMDTPNPSDSTNLVMITIGCGLRINDAWIPNVGIVYNRTTIALHYDLNNSSLKNSGFTRRGFELALTQRF